MARKRLPGSQPFRHLLIHTKARMFYVPCDDLKPCTVKHEEILAVRLSEHSQAWRAFQHLSHSLTSGDFVFFDSNDHGHAANIFRFLDKESGEHLEFPA